MELNYCADKNKYGCTSHAHDVHWKGISVKGNMGAHLQGVSTKYVARSRKNATVEENTSSLDHTSDRGQAMKRKARAMQENRVSRVEALRAQVRAGTYRVDTRVLAEHMLANETHFMESIMESTQG